MHDHAFHATPVLSGVGFENYLNSFRSDVPAFRAKYEGSLREEFRWRVETVKSSSVTLLTGEFNGSWSFVRETNERTLSLFFPFSGGGIESKIDAKHVTISPNEFLVAAMPLVEYIRRNCQTDHSTLAFVFDSSTVVKVLSSVFEGADLSELDLASVLGMTTALGCNLSLILRSIALGMRENRLLEKSPKSMALLTEAALLFIFENIPNRLHSRLHGRSMATAPFYVKDAVDYMHANLHQPLTITDIAEVVGTNVRSLQFGFQRYKNTTPRHYLRRIRLDAVHAELSSPLNILPVSEVALKWGFSHLGRFSAQYKATYGVVPSKTAQAARQP